MNAVPTRLHTYPELGEGILADLATTLAQQYEELYGEQPLDPRASLTANLVAWVFEDGLGALDRAMLDRGQASELQSFRDEFFDVVDEQLGATVADLTGLPVTYSFFGFDPKTRTTHGVFVLEVEPSGASQQRRALIGWSEQVRRNARRLRAEHVATREAGQGLREELRRRREESGHGDQGSRLRRSV